MSLHQQTVCSRWLTGRLIGTALVALAAGLLLLPASAATQWRGRSFVDSFSRRDGSGLGRAWDVQQGGFTVDGGVAYASGRVGLATLRGVRERDVDVSVDVAMPMQQPGWGCGPIVRYNDVNNFYQGGIMFMQGTFQAFIQKTHNGVNGLLAVRPLPGNPGSAQVRFRAIGPNLEVYIDGQLVLTASDRSLRSGTVGMRGSDTASFDNFTY